MNLPPQLIASLNGLSGYDAAAFKMVHEAGGQVNSIRINPEKYPNGKNPDQTLFQNNAGYWNLHTSPVPWNHHGIYLDQRPSYTLDPLLHAGAYYVQEASSMFVAHAVNQLLKGKENLKALDLCAAPGGKTTLLASLPQFSLLVANEVITSRVNILYENLVKWGSPHVFVSRNDPATFGSLTGYFDFMLIDAPCSGSGLFRRDPDAIAEWSLQQVNYCSARQQRILEDALPALKTDGLLIYSTCSYSKEENEDILDLLCEKHQFESLSLEVPPEWGIVESISEKTGAKGYRFYPDKLKGEGLFLACLQKKEDVYTMGWKSRQLEKADRTVPPAVLQFLREGQFSFFKKEENVFIVPSELEEDLSILSANLQLRKSGVLAGTVIRNELIPEHELALSTKISDEIPAFEVDLENAIRFLRKENLPSEGLQKGWTLVRFGGLNLGWIKVLPGRINNYYPANWRITLSK